MLYVNIICKNMLYVKYILYVKMLLCAVNIHYENKRFKMIQIDSVSLLLQGFRFKNE